MAHVKGSMDIDRKVRLREIDVDEASVVARAQDGDAMAFEALVVHYQQRLLRVAIRMLRERGAAEDAVQEALLQAWRSLPQLSDSRTFGGWIYKLTTNTCLDVLRKRSRRKEVPDSLDDLADSDVMGQGAKRADPANVVEALSQRDGLLKVVSALPPDLGACWVLKELEGKSYAEIAEILDVTPTVVRGRLSRARSLIMEGMAPWK